MTVRSRPTPGRVVVLDPRHLVRQGLLEILSADPELDVQCVGDSQSRPLPEADLFVTPDPTLARGRPSLSLEEFDAADAAALIAAVRVALSAAQDAATAEAGATATERLVRLSAHERAVLTCIGNGLTAAQSAEHLGVSRKSVENAKRRVFDKLGARSQAEAVSLDHAARHQVQML